jgi:hypothetical protein
MAANDKTISTISQIVQGNFWICSGDLWWRSLSAETDFSKAAIEEDIYMVGLCRHRPGCLDGFWCLAADGGFYIPRQLWWYVI